MKEVTLRIPDTKFELFMELTRQLGIETLAESQEVPEWQKQVVRQRIQKSEENPEQLLVWDIEPLLPNSL